MSQLRRPAVKAAMVLFVVFYPLRPSPQSETISSAKISDKRIPGTKKISCDVKDPSFLRNELTKPCQKQGFSQGNQDCQLDAIFKNLGTTNKFYVEYGFNTKEQCSSSGPNTCKLWKEHGWTGLLLDGKNENPAINLHAHYLYGNNAADILRKYGVPSDLDFLSGDMDSHDYFVMENILESFHPQVVTTEYNSNWPIDFAITQVDPTLDPSAAELQSFKFRQCVWGASALAMKILLEKHSYSLIGVTPRLDLIWGRQDSLDCFDVPSFDEYEHLMKLGPLHHRPQTDMSFLSILADVSVWSETKDINEAKTAAQMKDNMKSSSVLPCYKNVAKNLIKERS